MKTKTIGSFLLISGAIFAAGSATAQIGGFGTDFQKRFYLGVGAGGSTLEPWTTGTTFTVEDDSDTGGIVFLGVDLTRRITLELQYADLGNATLIDQAEAISEISYAEGSLSGLYYLWNGLADDEYLDADGLDSRAGLSVYGRLGAGAMDNDSRGNVTFTRENDFQLLAGLGVEYGLSIGLAARAEYIRYDTDAEYAGLSVLYRFGGRRPQVETIDEPELPVLPAPSPVTKLPPPPVPAELPSLPKLPELPELAVVPVNPDTSKDANDRDGDGISNSLDDCPDTAPGTPVNKAGCEIFNGVIEGVNFLSGSDTLTDLARASLDEVVATLDSFPEIRLSIEAHTDSRGDEAANLELSRTRALSVVRYLIAQGVSIERLRARAYGEARPIADNSTEDGRLLNRRVEFLTLP